MTEPPSDRLPPDMLAAAGDGGRGGSARSRPRRTRKTTRARTAAPRDWTIADTEKLYGIKRWGQNYFGINRSGHVEVRPFRSASRSVDLKQLVDDLQERGIQLPLLLRFDDIIKDRLTQIHSVFTKAIKEFDYQGDYRCVYPIKVNQQRHIVEQVFEVGRKFGFGLEAGSKPELLAVMATVDDENTPIICNGFKDDEFIEAVILATKMGKNIIPVVEKFSELETIIRYAKQHDVRPAIGMRVKLAARGAGRWEESGGVRSKFGLFLSEVLQAIEVLKHNDMLGCLNLLHFHLGSQINDIRMVKGAIIELTRIYVDLRRSGADLKYVDVGGGLGVDYDGTKSSVDSSMNYTAQEYANDVVYHIKEVCDQAGIEHPTIVSESGRAITAYHSVLVFNVIGRSGFRELAVGEPPDEVTRDSLPPPVRALWDAYTDLRADNIRECFHDAQLAHDQALSIFNLGYCTLEHRALAERLYFCICLKVRDLIQGMEEVPPEFSGLETLLCDTYFCNFSIFQSMPDSWAIDQLFPIMPIHRLKERPDREAILVDITCDSDGKVDHFISARGSKRVLELHTLERDEPYYIGVFLLGAYQEILGDLHNLFGDTNAVHITLDAQGAPVVEEVIEGDTVREVLEYVQFSADGLKRSMRKRVERAVRQKTITLSEANALLRFYESGLEGYTYLE